MKYQASLVTFDAYGQAQQARPYVNEDENPTAAAIGVLEFAGINVQTDFSKLSITIRKRD